MSNTTSPEASPALAPTVTPAELGSFLDLVASAPVALRDVPRMNNLLARLIGLANTKGPIGVVPDEAEMRQKYLQEAAAKPPAALEEELRKSWEALKDATAAEDRLRHEGLLGLPPIPV